MISQYIGWAISMLILIPLCAIGIPLYLILCITHPWLLLAIPLGILWVGHCMDI